MATPAEPASAKPTRVAIAMAPAAPRVSDILGRRAALPGFVRMRRSLPESEPIDIAPAVQAALEGPLGPVVPGSRIAIAVGSRGITGLVMVVRECVRVVRGAGGEPFIVPAMGSHGGATAEGQRAVLARLGIEESTCDAPVLATMDAVDLGEVGPGLHAHLDANVAGAGGVIVVNRLKSHTSFTGLIESGLAKMIGIGLGKQRGAEQIHDRGPAVLERRILACAHRIIDTGLVVGGLALIEDRAHRLATIEFVTPSDIGGPGEQRLLDRAKSLEARLPVASIDVLIIDELGKDKSGTGIDTNVIGRRMIRGESEPERPLVINLVVLGLTEASGGNATGIGLADFVPARLMSQLDLVSTYMNSLTAGLQGVQRAQLPIVLDSDQDVVEAAALTAAIAVPEQARMVRIRDTLSLDDVMVSKALEAEFAAQSYITLASDGPCFGFDETGRISSW